MRPKGQVPQWKIDAVESLAKLINEYPVVCLIDMTSFPSKQLLKTRKLLKELALIKMSKKSTIQRALEKTKKKELVNYLKGQPAMLFTKEAPFKIAKILNENKANAPAKPNSIMPKEILIPAGETSFSPGPIVGELQKAGIKAAIERGKVVIKEESLIAKAGERIDAKKAEIINKLGIEPIELKLRLIAAWENNFIFREDALGITTEQVLENLKTAGRNVFNLTYSIGYPTKYNIKLFIGKAFNSAKAVALKIKYECAATVKELLKLASEQAKALEEKIPEQIATAQAESEQKGG